VGKTGEVKIVRHLDAKPDQVYRAWTEPEQFQHWWGGAAAEVPLDSIEMDVRDGGSWRATIKMPGAGEFPFHGLYREVVPNEKIVFSLIDPNDPDHAARAARGADEEAMMVTFTEQDGGTELVFRQASDLPDEEREKAAAGMSSFFDALADHLAKG
jgi:uncharacterized protein YndB with AHSA1/START domain